MKKLIIIYSIFKMKRKATFFELLIVGLIPLAGIFFYIINRKKVSNPLDYIYIGLICFGIKLLDYLYTTGFFNNI